MSLWFWASYVGGLRGFNGWSGGGGEDGKHVACGGRLTGTEGGCW